MILIYGIKKTYLSEIFKYFIKEKYKKTYDKTLNNIINNIIFVL